MHSHVHVQIVVLGSFLHYFSLFFNSTYPVNSIAKYKQNVGIKIPRMYIAFPVNSTGEVNSLLDFLPVNSSLHNLPVYRIFMNISF